MLSFSFKCSFALDLKHRTLLKATVVERFLIGHCHFSSGIRFLVDSLLIKFRSDTLGKKIEDYLLLFRVGNTIAFDQPYDFCQKHRELLSLFLFKYTNKIEVLTDATISIGYSLYSKKYDLQFGGVKTKNNYYRIVH
jgi:hypothetical protein